MSAEFPVGQRMSPDSCKIAFLLSKVSAFQPVANNRITIIEDGVAAYTTLMELLANAKKSIEISTFILGRDEVGHTLVDLLACKDRQGVAVRLLLDALGCLAVRGDFVRPLRKSGGRIGVFLPLLPLRRRWSANLRNHRKMVIVDGRQAIVGGMNLAREYMGPEPLEKRWKDVSMLIKGCDVCLIMPQRSNHILVDLAGRSFLPDLMAAGVRLFYYQPGMLHAKLISINRWLAVVGTANMDVRSFQLNFEIATFLYDSQDVAKVIGVIESIMAESGQIDAKQIVQKRQNPYICRRYMSCIFPSFIKFIGRT